MDFSGLCFLQKATFFINCDSSTSWITAWTHTPKNLKHFINLSTFQDNQVWITVAVKSLLIPQTLGIIARFYRTCRFATITHIFKMRFPKLSSPPPPMNSSSSKNTI